MPPMEVQQLQRPPEKPAMALDGDDASMERSRSFVMALQELKNLRPQLYSAAEYCERSYLRSEQKSMVLDHGKEYVARALVNALDHLGTVAYNLTDLLEQQSLVIATTELKVLCLNRQLLASRTYKDNEGLRQQQLLESIPRYHKHYHLPNSINKKVHFSPYVQVEPGESHIQATHDFNPSEQKRQWESSPNFSMSYDGAKSSLTTPGLFHLLDSEESACTKSLTTRQPVRSVVPTTGVVKHSFGVAKRGFLVGSKSLTAIKSFNRAHRPEILRTPVRTKSMLSALFLKQKARKMKTSPIP